MTNRSLVYIAFDRFPAPKGAATHIAAFAEAFSVKFDEMDLITVSDSPSKSESTIVIGSGNPIRHIQLPAIGSTLVERVMGFRTHLRCWWPQRRPEVAHVRSIFEGYPIAREKRRWCERFVFEVNGLPSIELKYHYPQVADDRELMRKLIAQEQACLDAADLILTVSQVNAEYLRRRGVDSDRLCVIPNGVDTDLFRFGLPQARGDREVSLLYSGTLASWQGVSTAIEALSLYRQEAPARLKIVGTGRPVQCRNLLELAWKLGVGDFVQIIEGVSQRELAELHHEADFVLVPLLYNDRNVIQGCSPLKLLEAMSAGTPIIASDLPVTREIVRDGIDAILVKPGSAKAIKEALLRFDSEPELGLSLSKSARAQIEKQFTWQHSRERLIEAYRRLF